MNTFGFGSVRDEAGKPAEGVRTAPRPNCCFLERTVETGRFCLLMEQGRSPFGLGSLKKKKQNKKPGQAGGGRNAEAASKETEPVRSMPCLGHA